MTTSNLYQLAVISIHDTIRAKQSELDALASDAKRDFELSLKESLIGCATTPQVPVITLLATTIAVGREDGYPALVIPDSTRNVLRAAINAGIIKTELGAMTLHKDCSGYSSFSSAMSRTWTKAYDTWLAATTFRNLNAGASSL